MVFVHAIPARLATRVEQIVQEHTVQERARVKPRLSPACWSELRFDQIAVLGVSGVSDQLVFGAFPFDSNAFTAENLAAELMTVGLIWFEVYSPAISSELGQRFCFAPGLGMHHGQVDSAGNQVLTENQIETALEETAGLASKFLVSRLESILAKPWNDQFEVLRLSGIESQLRSELAS